jgi:hypothetical protein
MIPAFSNAAIAMDPERLASTARYSDAGATISVIRHNYFAFSRRNSAILSSSGRFRFVFSFMLRNWSQGGI